MSIPRLVDHAVWSNMRLSILYMRMFLASCDLYTCILHLGAIFVACALCQWQKHHLSCILQILQA